MWLVSGKNTSSLSIFLLLFDLELSISGNSYILFFQKDYTPYFASKKEKKLRFEDEKRTFDFINFFPTVAEFDFFSLCFPMEGSQVVFRTCNLKSILSGLLDKYRVLVERGELQHDPFQERVASELESLLGRLEQYEKDMEDYHVKLAEWEQNREKERRRLLMEEAESKQQGDAVNKRRSKLFETLMFRKKAENIEPGVGKWVSYLNREKKLDSLVGRCPAAPHAPRGLYIYGNVGSGKTMLMDMFFNATQGIVKHRQRYHFHEAMLKINEDMHKIWKNQVREKSSQSSFSSWIMNLPFDTKVKEWLAGEEKYKQEVQMKHILPAVADKFLIDQQAGHVGASILCFDEIQTVDVFAIVALSGIISRLLSTGTVLVATSNRAPNDLNQDGMQKDIFQKFVIKLEEHCEFVLIGSEIDYRRFIAQRSFDQVHYFWPLDCTSVRKFENMWVEVTSQLGGQITSETVPVMFGRKLEVPESCNGVARFAFDFLCGQPVGAADYIALAKNYHTVFISNIPIMSMRIRDKARRFITLIDELYNHHCCLFCLAATSIEELFQGTEEGALFDLESFQFETEAEGGKLRRNVLVEGNVGSVGAPTAIVSMLSGQEEMFAFRRAVSRLIEMQTPLYLEGVRNIHPYFQRREQESSVDPPAPRFQFHQLS
ncbi:lactation elevated protein 1 isoform X1 [Cucumis melo var. makuwa]|uniref:Lactation elevated protein 1 isoform X1 n=1 Tax=Cucumis melo var. makuwa TaxID=1194695 RepID=A0A5A7TBP6_CUCMM|nr:lactation elevated protein 1 isoform X1 [Cucumis melo var. makuwa]